MGSLRLLLALSIVLAHSKPIFGSVGMGAAAVPAFFVISGFYMHMVLATKYADAGGAGRFYVNRFLRLFPMYWVVVAAVIAISFVPNFGVMELDRIAYPAQLFVSHAFDGSFASWLAAVPNFLIIGADWLRAFAVQLPQQTIVPLASDAPGTIGLYQYLLVPQIWSVSNEIAFYALSPFLVRLRHRRFALALLGALLLPIALPHLPWEVVLPTQNAYLFVFGMAASRAAALLTPARSDARWAIAVVPLALCTLSPSLFSAGIWSLCIWAAYACCLPALFAVSQRAKLDRAIGDLSYPVYLVHGLVVYPAEFFGAGAGAAAIAVSCALAWLLVQLVDRPVERIRAAVSARGLSWRRPGRPDQQAVLRPSGGE